MTGSHANREVVLVLALLGTVALTGCLHSSGALGGGTDGDVSTEPTVAVPSGADYVVRVDGGLVEDPTTESLVDAVIERRMRNSPDYQGPESYQDVLGSVSEDTGLDPSGLNELVVFGETPDRPLAAVGGGIGAPPGADGVPEQNATGPYSAVIVSSDWTEDELTDAVGDNATVKESEYKGRPLFNISSETGIAVEAEGTTNVYAAGLADGVFVIGQERAVRDTVDVAAGDADALSGDLLDELNSVRDGYVTFAATVPGPEDGTDGIQAPDSDTPSFSGDVEMVSGSYYTQDGNVGMTANIRASSEAAAGRLEAALNSTVSAVGIFDEEASNALEPLEIRTDGSTVTVSYEAPPETAARAIGAVGVPGPAPETPPSGSPGGLTPDGGENGSGDTLQPQPPS